MPQDYGAMQPVADMIHNGIDHVEHFFGVNDVRDNTHSVSTPDPNYHSQMLANANASFANQAGSTNMSKFEQSSPHHQVHEIHRPQGHGYIDQKYGKGNRAPIAGSVPQVDSGTVPGADGAGSPGMPSQMNQ